MGIFAITVVGTDRPGIVAEVTESLADRGANIEDSSMTLLRGSFAWMVVVAAPAEVGELSETLEPTRRSGLTVDVVELPAFGAPSVPATHTVAVHGADRPGIVAAITTVIAKAGGNITDLSTRLSGSLYVIAADVVLAPESVRVVTEELRTVATELDVEVAVHAIEVDEGF